MSYVVTFCRMSIALVFLASFLSKVRHRSSLRQSIAQFRLLPPRLIGPAALLLLALEAAVPALVLAGGRWLALGFALALALLLLFSAALASLLVRRIATPCGCFGASRRPVSAAELWRNAGFLLCTGTGYAATMAGAVAGAALAPAEWALITIGAGIFVGCWTQLGEIVAFFQSAA
jgi:hypothetical protein